MAVGGSSCMDGGAKKPKGAKKAKRKLTPYNKFVKKMFKEFRIKYPDYSAPAIMKEIGIEWRKTKA